MEEPPATAPMHGGGERDHGQAVAGGSGLPADVRPA
jgi:hypothetical protein